MLLIVLFDLEPSSYSKGVTPTIREARVPKSSEHRKYQYTTGKLNIPGRYASGCGKLVGVKKKIQITM